MWELVILAIIFVLVIVAYTYDDPNCNHKHDFEGPDAMPLLVDGVLVAWCCANPRCTVIRLEEDPDIEED